MIWKRRTRRPDKSDALADALTSPKELLQVAETEAAAENFDAAAESYERLLAFEPFPFDVQTKVWTFQRLIEVRCLLGDVDVAANLAAEAVLLAGEGDSSTLAVALWNVGYVAWRRHDYGFARANLQDAVRLGRAAADTGAVLGPALLNLARVALAQGRTVETRSLIDELLALPAATSEASFLAV